VSIIEGRGNLLDDALRSPCWQGALLVDELFEGEAFEVLHDDKVGAVVVTDVVDDDDIGMAELGSRAGLSLEALDELLVEGELGREDLDGHVAIEGRLEGAVDHGHAPTSQLFDDLIAT
jgi:hypothetical protein